MKRDMDLARQLLLALERDERLDGKSWLFYGDPSDLGISNASQAEVFYHLNLLIEEGYVHGKQALPNQPPPISRLTWRGHELLDDIRGETVWGQAKERAKGLGGAGMGLLWELAKAEIRKQLGLG